MKVIPHSREQSIIKISDGAFKIRLKSAPKKGKANQELVKLLAQYFEISKNQVKIVRGQKSKNKIILILGL